MNNLQKAAGFSAIIEAVIYLVAFVYFGAIWSYPADGTAADKMAYLTENQLVFSIIYFLMYAVFGVFLAVIVVGLQERLKNSVIAKVGAVFGLVWVVLVIASGMLATIGLSHAIDLMDSSADDAFDLWRIVSVLIESLGGGNELVGGLWVLLVSIAALNTAAFPKTLNYLGIIVGVCGLATTYPDDIFTALFGITQIIWFVWLGVVMLSHYNTDTSAKPTAAPHAE
ncbi:hypothetical protein [Alteromonas sp. CYL-A6]|uniref:hypothetical protein n=1 Tax=Alteromonas nitratireducens TaxID=3390813 RepID=UPI0034B7E7BB